MKTTYLTLLSGLILSSPALAGSYGKNYSDTTPPPVALPQGCQCFAAGTQGFSLYGAALLGSETFGDSAGAGMSYSLFPTENLGFEADATWGFADSAIHTFNASLILRAPIKEMCLAPYALIGAGIHTDGVKQGTWHVGAGVDMRLTQDCMGIFVDARRVFAEETGDYTLVRAGMRVNF